MRINTAAFEAWLERQNVTFTCAGPARTLTPVLQIQACRHSGRTVLLQDVHTIRRELADITFAPFIDVLELQPASRATIQA